MPQITKHVGKMKDAGTRVAVVFRSIPAEPDHALVVSTDNLPALMHDSLIETIDSAEGQEVDDLQKILHRRQFPDGVNMLQALHQGGYMIKVKAEDVNMMPRPGQTIALDKLNEEIAKLNPDADAPATTPQDADLTKTEAKNLLAQADSLEDQAKTMRENAYQMDESLRPKRGRPAGTKKS
jgi:hypothetical protein|tara:strand:- start:644 stop:1186 length:543 start_codon:yes stop_codon:yes gene_type:complete